MKTYIIENKDNEVLGYFCRLSDAKYYLVKQFNYSTCSILMMQGDYFGEGWHKYRLVFNGKTFNKVSKKDWL